jgi:hypothetical protein
MKWSFAALRMSYESLQDCMAVTNPNISTCSQRTKEITNFRNLTIFRKCRNPINLRIFNYLRLEP